MHALDIPPEREDVILAQYGVPADETPAAPNHKGHAGAFDVPSFLAQHNVCISKTEPHEGGTKYVLTSCIFDESHKAPDAAVFVQADGKLGYKCFHNSCAQFGWREFRQELDPGCYDEPRHRSPPRDESEAPFDGGFDCGEPREQPQDSCSSPASNSRPFIAPVSIGRMIDAHPNLKPPLVHGLQRETEVANFIGAPKIGKSWALYGYGLSVASGTPWLGEFPCERRRVLLIDNELHQETLSHRIPLVAEAMGLMPADYEDTLDVLALRGQSYDLPAIMNSIIDCIEAGTYGVVCLDAWYRALPEGTSENDNAQVMRLYNSIDQACQGQGCAWTNVHHTSKGNQSDKSVTDIGAGAGAQSRAADVHLVMRPHEEAGVYVMEAVVRSFAPVRPLALRWQFPLWVPADVDPAMLKGRLTKSEEKTAAKDKKGMDAIIDALRHAGDWVPIKKAVALSGMGRPRFERLAAQLERDGHIESQEATVHGNASTSYRLKE